MKEEASLAFRLRRLSPPLDCIAPNATYQVCHRSGSATYRPVLLLNLNRYVIAIDSFFFVCLPCNASPHACVGDLCSCCTSMPATCRASKPPPPPPPPLSQIHLLLVYNSYNSTPLYLSSAFTIHSLRRRSSLDRPSYAQSRTRSLDVLPPVNQWGSTLLMPLVSLSLRPSKSVGGKPEPIIREGQNKQH